MQRRHGSAVTQQLIKPRAINAEGAARSPRCWDPLGCGGATGTAATAAPGPSGSSGDARFAPRGALKNAPPGTPRPPMPQQSLFCTKQTGSTHSPFPQVLLLHKISPFVGTNFSLISSFPFSSKSPEFSLENATATLGRGEYQTRKTGFQSLTKCNILSFHSFDKRINSFVFIYASPWQRDI